MITLFYSKTTTHDMNHRLSSTCFSVSISSAFKPIVSLFTNWVYILHKADSFCKTKNYSVYKIWVVDFSEIEWFDQVVRRCQFLISLALLFILLLICLYVSSCYDCNRVCVQARVVFPTCLDLAVLKRVLFQNHRDVLLGRLDVQTLEVSACILLLEYFHEIRLGGDIHFLKKKI